MWYLFRILKCVSLLFVSLPHVEVNLHSAANIYTFSIDFKPPRKKSVRIKSHVMPDASRKPTATWTSITYQISSNIHGWPYAMAVCRSIGTFGEHMIIKTFWKT